MSGYFYGWYMKCQSKDSTVAFISARHKNGTSETASLQVITEDGAWNIDMPGTAFKKDCANIFLGKNRFGKNGIRVNIDSPEARIKGNTCGMKSTSCADQLAIAVRQAYEESRK